MLCSRGKFPYKNHGRPDNFCIRLGYYGDLSLDQIHQMLPLITLQLIT